MTAAAARSSPGVAVAVTSKFGSFFILGLLSASLLLAGCNKEPEGETVKAPPAQGGKGNGGGSMNNVSTDFTP